MEVKEGGLGTEALQQLAWWHSLCVCVSTHGCGGGGSRLLQVLIFRCYPPWFLRQHLSLASCLPKNVRLGNYQAQGSTLLCLPNYGSTSTLCLGVPGVECKVNSLPPEPSIHPTCVTSWKPEVLRNLSVKWGWWWGWWWSQQLGLL